MKKSQIKPLKSIAKDPLPKAYFGAGLPQVAVVKLTGKLIVLEGADGSGRSTLSTAITARLEDLGYSVVNIGIKRSTLVADALAQAQNSNQLSHTTMSLFYATDFADQLENRIIPALQAGAIVLCDRYIYTLMARDIVRGASRKWVEQVYGFAIKPDLVFYLQVEPRVLIERNLEKNACLDYWESGMDLGLSPSLFDSFIEYQSRLQTEYMRMKSRYHFHVINGNRSIKMISHAIQSKILPLLS